MGTLSLLINDKIQSTIQKKITDADKRTKATARRKECQDYLSTEIQPKYTEAMKTKKSEDAKAIAPAMAKLSELLDQLSKTMG